VYPASTGDVRALDEVDLVVEAGRLTALVGPTGSGKSTLLRLLAGVDRPSGGSLVVAGRHLTAGPRARRAHRRHAVGFISQEPSENVLEHLDAHEHLVTIAASRRHSATAEARAAALAAVGLGARAGTPAGRLSGGEQQRLAVALASFGSPPLLLGDEPTAELDRASARLVVDALVAACRPGATAVVCSHDPDLVAAADRVVRLERGRVVDDG
jgi:ABC-type lipoprotein export system ATPase subunit